MVDLSIVMLNYQRVLAIQKSLYQFFSVEFHSTKPPNIDTFSAPAVPQVEQMEQVCSEVQAFFFYDNPTDLNAVKCGRLLKMACRY